MFAQIFGNISSPLTHPYKDQIDEPMNLCRTPLSSAKVNIPQCWTCSKIIRIIFVLSVPRVGSNFIGMCLYTICPFAIWELAGAKEAARAFRMP